MRIKNSFLSFKSNLTIGVPSKATAARIENAALRFKREHFPAEILDHTLSYTEGTISFFTPLLTNMVSLFHHLKNLGYFKEESVQRAEQNLLEHGDAYINHKNIEEDSKKIYAFPTIQRRRGLEYNVLPGKPDEILKLTGKPGVYKAGSVVFTVIK